VNTKRFAIGNQTNHRAKPVLAPYAYALERGFSSFEWLSDKDRGGWGEADFEFPDRKKLRDTVKNRGLRLSVHAPHGADPCDFDGAGAIYRSIDFATESGASLVNIHLFPEHGLDTFVRVLTPVLYYAASANIKISLENTPATTPEQFNEVFILLQRLPVSQGTIGMCYDMGHANLFPETRNDYLRYLDRVGRHVPIIHWHAHENWGDQDSHLPLFTGPSAGNDGAIRGLVRRLKDRGFQGSVVLESWPESPELLVQAQERLDRLIAET
jgi:sugar phosphate isomerase/epimerase